MLTLAAARDRWVLKNKDGTMVGKMAKSFSSPKDTEFVSGQIGALIRWRESDVDDAYRHRIKREEWNVVLPEFVFQNS